MEAAARKTVIRYIRPAVLPRRIADIHCSGTCSRLAGTGRPSVQVKWHILPHISCMQLLRILFAGVTAYPRFVRVENPL